MSLSSSLFAGGMCNNFSLFRVSEMSHAFESSECSYYVSRSCSHNTMANAEIAAESLLIYQYCTINLFERHSDGLNGSATHFA